MTKTHIFIFILILLILSLSYLLIEKSNNNKVIEIPQIKIISNKSSNNYSEKKESMESELPSEILSKLKIAVAISKKNLELSEEEQAKSILATLKRQTHMTASTEENILKALKSIEKTTTVQTSNHKTIVKSKSSNTQRKKTTLKENNIENDIENTLDSIQKILHETKNSIHLKKNKILTHKSSLSREEEVAQYKKISANGLEIVSVSNLFEIDTPENRQSDTEYFKPIASSIHKNNHKEIEFVKTLGIINVSKKYEIGNLEIPKMVELAKEGVVDISSASIETEALRKLKFINPLEVIEISSAFETIEASKYIK